MAAMMTPAKSDTQAIDLALVLHLPKPLWVQGASLDSRAVLAGDVFVALAGASGHGLSFLAQAIDNGAVAVLLDADDHFARTQLDIEPVEIPAFYVQDLRTKLGVIARAVYGSVDEELALVGVTGTDGKTSITHFVAQLMGLSSSECAVLGTVGNGFLDKLQSATHTTGDVFQVYKQLAALRFEGAEAVAMEVSSHALHQERVSGLSFKVSVLSNLGRDHLDYHGTVERYADAKLQLFDQRSDACVINADDTFGQRVIAQRPDAITYSASDRGEARWKASDCEYSADGISCQINTPSFNAEVLLPILGAFNVSNILAACAVAECLGVKPADIVSHLPKLKPVTGRAELLRSSKGSRVVIDYAHTAQALAAILATLRDHFTARIWCVFGCGGDRDRSKRPEMAKAAMLGADCLVVTSDNPRSEDPQFIINDVVAGFSAGVDAHVEPDRAAAIAYALEHASADDCVLIAGKGHEDYQVLAGRTIDFSDRAEVLGWQAGAA